MGSRPTIVVVEESYTTQTTTRFVTAVYIAPIAFLEVSLRSSSTDLHVGESLIVTRDATRPHAPPKDSASAPHVPHVPYVPSSAPTDVISAISALATSASSHLLTSAPHHPLTINSVDLKR